jgi:endonuclease-3
MRTSRISRDTSRLLAATRARPPRQSLSPTNAAIRDFSLNSHGTRDGQRKSELPLHHGSAQSESDLSSAPESNSENGETLPSKKRKRGQAAPVAVKQEIKEITIATIASPKKETKPKKARRAPVKKIQGTDGKIKIEPPPNWEEMYALTRQMRNENIAPVDTMGCESLADRNTSPRDQRFQTLVSLMLSSQTKDTVTSVAIKGMQDNMPGVCNVINCDIYLLIKIGLYS